MAGEGGHRQPVTQHAAPVAEGQKSSLREFSREAASNCSMPELCKACMNKLSGESASESSSAKGGAEI